VSDVLTEQEQIEQFKSWWKENGTQIIVIVLIAASGYFGFKWWQGSQEVKQQAVSTAYERYVEALAQGDAESPASDESQKSINYLADQLIENHSGSHYAVLAAINTAAFDIRNGDLSTADERLTWAGQQVKEPADVLLVRYRHALLKAEMGQVDEALSMLSGEDNAFASLYAEARGDIQLNKSDGTAALLEYERARDTALPEDSERVGLLSVKISGLQSGAASLTLNPQSSHVMPKSNEMKDSSAVVIDSTH